MTDNKEQNFTKVYEIAGRIYNFELNLDLNSSILNFNVIDQTDIHNY